MQNILLKARQVRPVQGSLPHHGKPINETVILDHWDNVMRPTAGIKTKALRPSAVLSKLRAYRQQKRLHFDSARPAPTNPRCSCRGGSNDLAKCRECLKRRKQTTPPSRFIDVVRQKVLGEQLSGHVVFPTLPLFAIRGRTALRIAPSPTVRRYGPTLNDRVSQRNLAFAGRAPACKPCSDCV